jgi:hypothetical protein
VLLPLLRANAAAYRIEHSLLLLLQVMQASLCHMHLVPHGAARLAGHSSINSLVARHIHQRRHQLHLRLLLLQAAAAHVLLPLQCKAAGAALVAQVISI